ncbi:four helix bundle protein [Pinibacter aurantiacus]|uniref:Four helix bundle protein n=1 Tax=Pinibacter aurantiacus TaxID=2851599 RepID=A0A9E2S8U7_9BACT|nr:four helix bundle protein [Pinibacter aurantiacus]MBV4356060.1 four helix bundle protein [Pinibacter aurantiacus]
MNNYTELEVWKAARDLVNDIYIQTKFFPKEELFGLVQQMRRCAVSVPSNIAEGCGRNSAKNTIQFLFISRGSLFELETQLYIALDQQFISEGNFDVIFLKIRNCKKLLHGFINYYQKLSAIEK